MIKANYHTHSVYCDGKNTVREMVDAACSKNLSIIGFSGHSPMDFENDWAMNADRLSRYVSDIEAIRNEYKGKIDVLLGIELDLDFTDVNLNDFDYIIGSMHQFRFDGADFPIDLSAESLKFTVDKYFNGDWYKMCEFYYENFSEFICKVKPDIVGHFDLVTKYNLDGKLFDENNELYKKAALKAIDKILESRSDIIFEVNTGAMYRVGKKEPYPAPFIMEYLKKMNANITVTSDSHCIESIDFAFDSAYNYCKSFGFEKITLLTSEGRVFCDL